MNIRTRALVKTITWRIIASVTTFVVAWYVFSSLGTDSAVEAASIVAVIECVLKLVIYYLHERVWDQVNTDDTDV
jgi:uncharacterized membrane protein